MDPQPRTDDVKPVLTEMSDGALAVAIGRYQQDALAEAYRRHAGAVFGLARRVLSDHTRAEAFPDATERCNQLDDDCDGEVDADALPLTWYADGVKQIGAPRAGIYINLVPVFAVLQGALLLGERLGLPSLIGGLLVLAGVMLTTVGPTALRKELPA